MFNFNQNVLPGYKQVNEYGDNNAREEYKRSIVDRAIGAITNTSITNALYNATDGDANTGFIQGLGQGVQAMNPLSDDVRYGQHYSADVLGNLGWKPEGALGKTAKFATSLAGDIILDPMTYINPIGAVAKVVGGTGTVSKAIGKKAVTMSPLTLNEAVDVVNKQYKAMGRPIDEIAVNNEASALVDSFNSKILKIKSGGDDFQIGTQNLPFVKKVKEGEKALGSFNKVLVKEDELRKFGDKTIAPYYNELSNKLKNYKAIKNFTKNSDIIDLAKTDKVGAAVKYKMDRMIKGYSSAKIGEDIGAYKAMNNLADTLEDFSDDEKRVFTKWYEEGGAKNMLSAKGVIAKVRDKANGNTEMTTALDKLTKELDEYMNNGAFYNPEFQKMRKDNIYEIIDQQSMADVAKHFDSYGSKIVADYVRGYADLKSKPMPEFKKVVDKDGVQTEILETADAEKFLNLSEHFTKTYADIADKEVKASRLSREAADTMKGTYMARIQTDEAKKWAMQNIMKEYNGKFNPEAFAVGYKKMFNKERKFNTLEESNEYMKKATGVDKWFEDDLVKTLQARQLASNDLLYNDEMVNAVKEISGVKWKPSRNASGEVIDNLPDGYTPVLSFIDLNTTLLKALHGEPSPEVLKYLGIDPRFYSPNNAYIPTSHEQTIKLARLLQKLDYSGKMPTGFGMDNMMMNRLNRESSIQKKMHDSEFLNLFDKYQTIWKMWNTVINPGFHVQNAASNAFAGFLGDGATAVDPRKLNTAKNIFDNVTPDKRMKFGDVELTHSQIKELARKHGILDNTFFQADLAKSFGDKGVLAGLGVKGEFDPTDMNHFKPYEIGGNVGAKIEGTQRLAMFINRINSGETIEQAVDSVNKYLFDYSDLTDFEKNVMKRVLPFYTFMRKNLPLTLEQMLTNPKVYQRTDKTLNNIELISGDEYVPDYNRTEFRRDHTQLPFTVDGSTFGVNLQLPYQQLDRISPNRLLGQSTPLAKIPYEGLTGEYAYTGIDIDSFGDYVASQTTPTKVLSMYGKKQGVDKELYAMGQLGGFPMGVLEPQEEPAYSMADMMR